LELSLSYPELKIATNQSDEFSHWMSGTGDPDYEDLREVNRAPRRRVELVEWLKHPLPNSYFYEDDWRDVCREKFPTAICALYVLITKNQWPAERWRVALQTWSDEKQLTRSWRYVAPLLQRMPNDVLPSISHSVTWWLQAVSKVLNHHETIFLDLCRRILVMKHQDGINMDRSVMRAINHPVGHITQALLNHWFHSQPNDNQGLQADLKAIFTTLCDTQIEQYCYARVLLAANVIALFRVDPEWTNKYLLPLFNWQLSVNEAQTVWEGFLLSPRLYRPLFTAFKTDFLETASHYDNLGEYSRQYAAILTYVALDPADTFTLAELYAATNTLPQKGLQESAQTIVYALEGAGDQREQYWINRIQPYWQMIWPKSRQLTSKAIAEQFARLSIAARGEFPTALTTVQAWLQPLEHPHYVVQLLQKSGLCTRFPKDTLILLNAIIDIDEQPWLPRELGDCLNTIQHEWLDASQDNRYQRLMEGVRRRG
jgi:hypothetical protein